MHADHGIGRFDGLTTITALGAPHDCLEIGYAGGDKLYLPVENIELLSRYGSADGGAQLDRLGGAAWQTRKARLKQRLREIASELIKIAALRQLRAGARAWRRRKARTTSSWPASPTTRPTTRPPASRRCWTISPPASRWTGWCAATSASARPRWRCGPPSSPRWPGFQVAVVVPTTLLARQHFATFSAALQGAAGAHRPGLAPGQRQGPGRGQGRPQGRHHRHRRRHARAARQVASPSSGSGLLIVDEEQHFGVAHKERLKQLREDVHVLTLTATPIPRTLQLALSGVRELSLITTPPVDRLAVRTYISPFDPVIIREALRRERYRGGQSFYVVPRIADLEEVRRVPGRADAGAEGRRARTASWRRARSKT